MSMKSITINNIGDFDKIPIGSLLTMKYTKIEQRKQNGLYVLMLLLVIVEKYNSDLTVRYALNKSTFEPVYMMYLGMTNNGVFFLQENTLMKLRTRSAALLKFPFDIKIAR